MYALAVLGALLGQILDIGYLLHYIFILSLTLPVLALAISLPAMLGCRGQLELETARTVRGQGTAWSLVLTGRSRLPVGRVKGRVRAHNCLTGATERRRFSARGVAPGWRETWEADTKHCGLIEYRIEKLWACDCLGLFSLPVRRGNGASLLVCPEAEPPGRLYLPESTGQPRTVPRGKSASGEDYELRSYRAGDSLRLVHWKQSAKRDELTVRELLEDRGPLVVLTFDHFGAPVGLDRTLDRVAGHAQALLERQRPFEVRWLHPDSGEVRRYAVESERDYLRCLTAVLSDPAPVTGRSILDQPLAAKPDTMLYRIHISEEEVRYGRG